MSEAQIRSEIARLTGTIPPAREYCLPILNLYSHHQLAQGRQDADSRSTIAQEHLRQSKLQATLEDQHLRSAFRTYSSTSSADFDHFSASQGSCSQRRRLPVIVAFSCPQRPYVKFLVSMLHGTESHCPVPQPTPSTKPPSTSRPPPPQYTRKSGHMIPAHRTYKPTSSRGRRGGAANRNMTLNNNRRPYQFVSFTHR